MIVEPHHGREPQQIAGGQPGNFAQHFHAQRAFGVVQNDFPSHEIAKGIAEVGNLGPFSQGTGQGDDGIAVTLKIHVLAEERHQCGQFAEGGFGRQKSARPVTGGLSAHEDAGAADALQRGEQRSQFIKRELSSGFVGHGVCGGSAAWRRWRGVRSG